MTGKFETLIGPTLKELTIENNKFRYQNVSIMGSILLKILPPSDLYAPFLLYKLKNGSVVNTLCKTCAESKIKICNHSEEQRSFIATYMISEIEFALTLNYKILQIYEAHVFVDSQFILRDFIQKLNYFKTLNSNCLKNLQSTEEKEKYCDYLNNKMQLHDVNYKLAIANIKPCNLRRNYFKLLCNSLFGKFIQRRDQTDILFVKSQEELTDVFLKGNPIEDFVCPNENICMLFIKKDVLKLPPNRKQNLYIGSQITAFARETIYKYVQTFSLLKDFKIYQVECDSIYFSCPKDAKIPIIFSDAVGDFKLEYSSNIINFYSFGPKHYSITFYDEENKLKNICKYSGLSLSNKFNDEIVNDKTFESFLHNFILDIETCYELKHKVTKSNFKSLSSQTQLQKFSFQNKISTRRIVDLIDTDHLTTYPYGFAKK